MVTVVVAVMVEGVGQGVGVRKECDFCFILFFCLFSISFSLNLVQNCLFFMKCAKYVPINGKKKLIELDTGTICTKTGK